MTSDRKEIIKQEKPSDHGVDLVQLTKVIWMKRILILKFGGAFFLVGLLIALTSKVEFRAYSKLMPEDSEGLGRNIGGLGSLAGLAGINLDMNTGQSLAPELYPEIVNSTPFQIQLINEPIYFSNLDSTISSFTYFKSFEKGTLLTSLFKPVFALKSIIKGIFFDDRMNPRVNSENEFRSFSKEDWAIYQTFKDRILITVDEISGIIYIRTEMPDKYAAARLTTITVNNLTKNITSYKTSKLKRNLEFIKQRFEEAKKEYEHKQFKLARFSDRNKDILSSFIMTELKRLNNEQSIAFEVYKGLATQLEQAKIRIKEETPVFTVLEPVTIPVEKFKPKRTMITFVSVFFGVFCGILFVSTKHIISKVYN